MVAQGRDHLRHVAVVASEGATRDARARGREAVIGDAVGIFGEAPAVEVGARCHVAETRSSNRL